MTQMLGMRLVTRRRGGLMADRSTIAISYYRFRVVESPSNGYTLRWSVVGYLTSKKGSCQDSPLGISGSGTWTAPKGPQEGPAHLTPVSDSKQCHSLGQQMRKPLLAS